MRLRIAVPEKMETCVAYLKRKAAMRNSGEIVYAEVEGYGRKTDARFAEARHSSEKLACYMNVEAQVAGEHDARVAGVPDLLVCGTAPP